MKTETFTKVFVYATWTFVNYGFKGCFLHVFRFNQTSNLIGCMFCQRCQIFLQFFYGYYLPSQVENRSTSQPFWKHQQVQGLRRFSGFSTIVAFWTWCWSIDANTWRLLRHSKAEVWKPKWKIKYYFIFSKLYNKGIAFTFTLCNNFHIYLFLLLFALLSILYP